ncbi:MAG: DUF4198 domain-containing protein [Cardiobacteriaceae bacterium]|nr:DUF4198 domain-containing protein [Cardiobacteriaceae bacterium]
MKKSLLVAIIAAASIANAHELWVTAPEKIAADEILKSELGYGHDFPAPEPIPAERLSIFKPLQLVDMDGKVQDLEQKGENYQYVSKDKIGKGVYWVSAIYQPTFWSKNKDGWKMQSLKEMPDASTCQQAQMFSKTLVVTGDAAVDVAAISKPIGQNLEIVPLADPTKVKVDEVFPLQVFYGGKPLADATVTATSDTFIEKDIESAEDHREIQAFSGKTSEDGKVNLVPLTEGLWKVKVAHKTPFEDAKTCMENSNTSIFVFPIGSKRAAPHEHHHHHH